MEVAGIDVVGPLPADLQSPDLVYMVGSPAASEQPLPAKSLIDFLTAPAAARVYKVNGMDPAGGAKRGVDALAPARLMAVALFV